MPQAADAPLRGRVAVVTGGGRGIGRESALRLAEAGAAVVVAARSPDEIRDVASEIDPSQQRALPIPTDVTDAAACHALIEQTVEALGRIDILLCNAGGGQGDARLQDTDLADWEQVLHVNLSGVFYCCRAALPHMVDQGFGRIMVMGSGTGHRPTGGFAAYSIAKAGASHLVRILAEETWEDGIEVNEIVPGPVHTAATEHVFTPGEAPPLAASERVKQPDEVADLVHWLATRPAGGPTGQTFSLARRAL